MRKLLQKTMILSMFCSAFLGAEEIPDFVKKVAQSIKPIEFYHDDMLTFGDNSFFTPMIDKHINTKEEAIEAYKTKIDENKTYRSKISELKAKNENFCEIFFEDLKELRDITIKKPLFKEVAYDNHDFRKAMGSCYYMGFDWVLLSYRYDGVKLTPNIGNREKPFSYTLYETNFLGKDNLLLEQNYFKSFEVDRDGLKAEKHKALTVLNKDLCHSVFKSFHNPNDYNMLKDRKVVDETILYHYENPIIMTYKGQDYIFGYYEDKENIDLYLKNGLNESPYSGFGSEDTKCVRTYWK